MSSSFVEEYLKTLESDLNIRNGFLFEHTQHDFTCSSNDTNESEHNIMIYATLYKVLKTDNVLLIAMIVSVIKNIMNGGNAEILGQVYFYYVRHAMREYDIDKHVYVLNLLISNTNINLNYIDSYSGKSLLHIHAIELHTESIQILLRHMICCGGGDIYNAVTKKNKNTALHEFVYSLCEYFTLVCKDNKIDACKSAIILLLDSGLDKTVRNKMGYTASEYLRILNCDSSDYKKQKCLNEFADIIDQHEMIPYAAADYVSS